MCAILHLFKTLQWLPMVFRIEPTFTTVFKVFHDSAPVYLSSKELFTIYPQDNSNVQFSVLILNYHQYLTQLIIPSEKFSFGF